MTRQEAINAFCKECIYDGSSGNGTWRDQTTNCTSPKCPLYEHRPVNQATANERKAEKLKNMTPKQRAAYDRKVKQAKERFNVN